MNPCSETSVLFTSFNNLWEFSAVYRLLIRLEKYMYYKLE
jgi:hypothetical protein